MSTAVEQATLDNVRQIMGSYNMDNSESLDVQEAFCVFECCTIKF